MVGQVALGEVATQLTVELGQARLDYQRSLLAGEVPEEGLQRLPNWRATFDEGLTCLSWILSE